MGKRLGGQLDLFVTPTRSAELAGIERQTAVALLQALLTEAVMALTSDPLSSGKKEAGNE